MHGHRTGAELEVGPGHGATDGPCIPAVVERRIGHGKTGGEDVRHVVEDDGDPGVPAFPGGGLQPFVALAVAALGHAASVDVSPAVKAFLLGSQAVVDHPPHGVRGGRVEARDEQEAARDGRVDDRGESAEVGIEDDAEALVVEGAEASDLRINRSFVDAAHRVAPVWARGCRFVGRRWLDGCLDLQRHAADEGDVTDAPVHHGGLALLVLPERPPTALAECLPQRFLDGCGELLARDLLLDRTVKADDLVHRDAASQRVVSGQRAGFGRVGVENDDGGLRLARRRGIPGEGGPHRGRGQSQQAGGARSPRAGRHGRAAPRAAGVWWWPRGRDRGRCASTTCPAHAHRPPRPAPGSARGGSGAAHAAGRR